MGSFYWSLLMTLFVFAHSPRNLRDSCLTCMGACVNRGFLTSLE